MPRTLCRCTGSAKRFHESQTEEDCSYINAYYTFQRSKDPESRNRLYQFLRCLGHTYDDALKTANEYHETDVNGNFLVKKTDHMQCSYVHFSCGDVVVDGGNISLSRVTCPSVVRIERKLFGLDYPTRRLGNQLCPIPMPQNLYLE